MKLLRLTAKNYRSLQDLNLSFASKYCTISGKNNSGKSSVIRLLSSLFRKGGQYPWSDEGRLDFKEDKTQWVKQPVPIAIKYTFQLSKGDDPALISFIEKMSEKQFATEESIELIVGYTLSSKDDQQIDITVNGNRLDEKGAKEIENKIRNSDLLFLYNSITPHEEYYFGRGRHQMFYDFVMSEEERKTIDEATKNIERRFRKLAREHKAGMNMMLGRLSEKYDVEFSRPEGYSTRHMPLGINLKDRNVEVPLSDWGSGTQNRTRILMAVLQAQRIKTTASANDKITPILLIEEPESFLHPSAQSEFGAILRALSEEFGLQTIVTTHSPYMLNLEEPASNILLCRDTRKGKNRQTCIVDTSSDNWMAPFADHLGIAENEFVTWRPVFSAYKSRALLVEGPTDKEYFEYLKQYPMPIEGLDKEIEIAPYGGKDTLKNTILVKFVLDKFDHVFVTYDLDADSEIKSALIRLGLKEQIDFMALGLGQPGKESIEGLLPERVLSTVNGRETALVMGLGSRDNKERSKAKEALKKKYLEEFKLHSNYTKDELKHLSKALKAINTKLAK